MAYKQGSTTVIDDNGKVDWTRLTGKPTNGATVGTTMLFNDVNTTTGSGYYLTGYGSAVWNITSPTSLTRTRTRYYYNCYVPPPPPPPPANCNCACYC